MALGDVESTFDGDDEGWVVAEVPGPPYDAIVETLAVEYASGLGNPGGSIHTTDEDATLFTFSAPGVFLGDQSLTYGGELAFDLYFVDNGLPPGSYHPDVVLWGGGRTLLIDNHVDPPSQDNAWLSFTVPLSTVGDWRLDSLAGPAATEADLRAVLGNLTAILIRGDYFAGIDQAHLDNVGLHAPPCPGDLDGDRDVDQADLGRLLSSYLVDGGGDLDDDGDTDQADLGILLAHYGQSC
jgi:Laminin B (Domain IV)